MAKSARASGIKKNKAVLRKRVFGPVETARNERLSAKLHELATKSKDSDAKMDIEQDPTTTAATAKSDEEQKAAPVTADSNDVDMDHDLEAGKSRLSKREVKRRQTERAARVEKKRKPRNRTTFASHPMKKKKNGGKR